MNKRILFTVFTFLVLTIVLLNSCSIKQKVKGTWTDTENDKWTFNANGKLEYENGGPDEVRTYEYDVIDKKLSIKVENNSQIFDVSFSSDGKTLILSGANNIGMWRTAGPGWGSNHLTKYDAKTAANKKFIYDTFGESGVTDRDFSERDFLDMLQAANPDNPTTNGNVEAQYKSDVIFIGTQSGTNGRTLLEFKGLKSDDSQAFQTKYNVSGINIGDKVRIYYLVQSSWGEQGQWGRSGSQSFAIYAIERL